MQKVIFTNLYSVISFVLVFVLYSYFGKKVNCERVGLVVCSMVWETTCESWASNPEVRDLCLILIIVHRNLN